MRRFLLIPLLVLCAGLLAACGSDGDQTPAPTPTPTPEAAAAAPPAEAAYRTLTIDQFADIVTKHPGDYTIVNVHIPYEGEVENTDAFIPYNDLDALTQALPDKNAPIILYCRSGRMSKEASEALVERGYTQVWDVPGGMIAWHDSGHPLLDQPQK